MLFSSYLLESDKPRFAEFVKEADSRRAGSIHVFLTDSFGKQVPVQIFHTVWLDIENGLGHILGIQEEREVDFFPKTTRSRELVSHGAEANTEGLLAEEQEDAVSVVSNRSAGSVKSAASVASAGTARSAAVVSVASAGQSERNVPALASWGTQRESVTVESTVYFRVIAESERCSTLFGFKQAPDAFFARIREADKLMAWIRTLQMRPAGHDPERIIERYGTVEIGTLDGVYYEADLAVSFVEMTMEKFPLTMRLKLYISPPKTKRKQTSSDIVELTLARLRAWHGPVQQVRSRSAPSMEPLGFRQKSQMLHL